MKTINIYGEKRFEQHTRIREACRGIVVKDEKILLVYEVNTDQWFIPGGGVEPLESMEDCCIRELAEETGYVINPLDHCLTINEYYEEWLFVSHYFICEITGHTQRLLTERERDAGLESRWILLEEAIDIFSKYHEYADDEMKRGAYFREYKALTAYSELLRL